MFLAIFSLSLALWSSQAIYIRAFYAAGQTLPPMLAGTVITLVMLPVYWWMHARFGAMGLAWASNIAILAHTATLAVLLHQRGLVPMGRLDKPELAKSLVAALLSAVAVVGLLRVMPVRPGHVWNAVLMAVGTAVWAAITWGVLRVSGAGLLGQLRRRRA